MYVYKHMCACVHVILIVVMTVVVLSILTEAFKLHSSSCVGYTGAICMAHTYWMCYSQPRKAVSLRKNLTFLCVAISSVFTLRYGKQNNSSLKLVMTVHPSPVTFLLSSPVPFSWTSLKHHSFLLTYWQQVAYSCSMSLKQRIWDTPFTRTCDHYPPLRIFKWSN